ncbi:hypothetical protein FPOAC1_003756 [Fusarium poae]|uniref:hypothetical protein n=1 Tax=Fusarium poae TaxID=36050 RepID=UPI001CE8ACE4|nr:hypothetical protein FPOAC1_003756 [Fusarium poae]KAG8677728.1 hypothetical protein FPOAC1_003756 [Fusarium poae]
MADHDKDYSLVQFKLHPHPGLRTRQKDELRNQVSGQASLQSSNSPRKSPIHRCSSVEQDQGPSQTQQQDQDHDHDDSCTINLCCHNTFWSDPLPNLTLHLHSSKEILYETDLLISDLPPPSPPNYVIASNNIQLWPSDDDDEQQESQQEELEFHLPLSFPARQASLSHWCFLAVVVCLAGIVVLFTRWSCLARVETVYIQPPFSTEVLPILDEYSHIIFEYFDLVQAYMPYDDFITKHPSAACNAILMMGQFYHNVSGRFYPGGRIFTTFYEDGDNHEYLPNRERLGIPPDATDNFRFCVDLLRKLRSMIDQWHSSVVPIANLPMEPILSYAFILINLEVMFPNGNESSAYDSLSVDWLEIFADAMSDFSLEYVTDLVIRDMEALDDSIDDVMRDLDLLNHIALQVNLSSHTWYKSTSMEKILNSIVHLQHNLTSLSKHVNDFIDGRNLIVDQEKLILEWLDSLTNWRCTHPSPYNLASDGVHSNPWAVWRPRSENGSFCLVPRCPVPRDDIDNILVKLTLPSAIQAYHHMADVMQYGVAIVKEAEFKFHYWLFNKMTERYFWAW